MAATVGGINTAVQAAPTPSKSVQANAGASKASSALGPAPPAPVTEAAKTRAAGQAKNVSATRRKSDNVQLSTQARALALYQQGYGVTEIAIILNVNVTTVHTYLGETTAKSGTSQPSPKTSTATSSSAGSTTQQAQQK
jgi:DNA-binding NarL/FixJ family response regulator